MLKPEMTLLCTALELVVLDLAKDPADAAAWAAAQAAVAHYEVGEEDDIEFSLVLEERDAGLLKTIVEDWGSGERLMLVRDRDVLKRALKAYRKRLKVTILDAESSLSGGAMSSGRESSILGVRPPDRYPTEVWEQLVRHKKLLPCGHGLYELAPGI
ncbi:MAG: hypothetical protein ACI8QC_004447 [Planctomycetota bacterium]|jgi:hypothetical protein